MGGPAFGELTPSRLGETAFLPVVKSCLGKSKDLKAFLLFTEFPSFVSVSSEGLPAGVWCWAPSGRCGRWPAQGQVPGAAGSPPGAAAGSGRVPPPLRYFHCTFYFAATITHDPVDSKPWCCSPGPTSTEAEFSFRWLLLGSHRPWCLFTFLSHARRAVALGTWLRGSRLSLCFPRAVHGLRHRPGLWCFSCQGYVNTASAAWVFPE